MPHAGWASGAVALDVIHVKYVMETCGKRRSAACAVGCGRCAPVHDRARRVTP
jgi:hypothetical protein